MAAHVRWRYPRDRECTSVRFPNGLNLERYICNVTCTYNYITVVGTLYCYYSIRIFICLRYCRIHENDVFHYRRISLCSVRYITYMCLYRYDTCYNSAVCSAKRPQTIATGRFITVY